VHRRIEAHQLHVLHRQVYAVSHTRLTTRGHWLALVRTGSPPSLTQRSVSIIGGMLLLLAPIRRCAHPEKSNTDANNGSDSVAR
jgi:hypothetical protein